METEKVRTPDMQVQRMEAEFFSPVLSSLPTSPSCSVWYMCRTARLLFTSGIPRVSRGVCAHLRAFAHAVLTPSDTIVLSLPLQLPVFPAKPSSDIPCRQPFLDLTS